MEEKRQIMQHKITMENREKLFLTGVEDVDSFCEAEIRVYTSEGQLNIKGEDLHMSRLNVDDGELCIEGEIESLVYSNVENRSGGFFSKLFK